MKWLKRFFRIKTDQIFDDYTEGHTCIHPTNPTLDWLYSVEDCEACNS